MSCEGIMAEGKWVSYLRVSTGRQARSGLGLESQRKAVEDFLNGGSWELAKEHVEVESGKKTSAGAGGSPEGLPAIWGYDQKAEELAAVPPAGLPHTRQPREPVLTSPECYRDGAPQTKAGKTLQ
jgi:hypothetical protein